jgi:hypothetical protein
VYGWQKVPCTYVVLVNKSMQSLFHPTTAHKNDCSGEVWGTKPAISTHCPIWKGSPSTFLQSTYVTAISPWSLPLWLLQHWGCQFWTLACFGHWETVQCIRLLCTRQVALHQLWDKFRLFPHYGIAFNSSWWQ